MHVPDVIENTPKIDFIRVLSTLYLGGGGRGGLQYKKDRGARRTFQGLKKAALVRLNSGSH